ncbi:MAG: CotH kinase family protein [Myxococcota bacterium]
MSATEEHLRLWIDDRMVDEVEVVALPEDVALARTPDGGPLLPTLWATPGAPNPEAASPSIDPSSVLFGDQQIVPLSLTIDPATLPTLDVEGGEGVPAALAFDGVTLAVWVRLTGSGSFEPLAGKPSWSIDVDRVVGGQRLRGLERIALDRKDPTAVRESLAYPVFAAVGAPAPRVGWVQLTVNGEDYGLYVHSEAEDDTFLARWFADPSGMLLEGQDDADLDAPDALELDDGERDDAFLAALAALLAAPPADPAQAEAALEALVDLDAFLAYAAAEAITMHADGYQRPERWRAYLDPADGRLRWLPHGTEATFTDPQPYDHGDGAVFRLCLDLPGCRARYLAALAAACDDADALDLVATFDARVAWLAPALAADPRRDVAPAELAQEQALTRTWLVNRVSALRAVLASLR